MGARPPRPARESLGLHARRAVDASGHQACQCPGALRGRPRPLAPPLEEQGQRAPMGGGVTPG
eukprot:4561441-Alexandrium_andersonii.AAC.1